MKSQKYKLFAILGPTSAGKTSLAIKLCQKLGGEIVSVDSRQVYKGLDYGTGKIPLDENHSVEKKSDHWVVDRVKIWGYDIVGPRQYFSAHDYLKYVVNLLESEKITAPRIFFVGGTGFYFDILNGRKKMAGVAPDQKLREELSKLSVDELITRLKTLDQDKLKNLDQKNPVRLIRAIEIAEAKKYLPDDFNYHASQTPTAVPLDFNTKYFGLTADRALLYQRVDRWLDSTFNEKLFEEVKSLRIQGYTQSPILSGLNYQQAGDYLDGKLSVEEAKSQAKYANHAYIRRQLTYFRKLEGVHWFDISQQGFDTAIERLVQSA